jgi:hypothetical protein
MSLDVSLIDRTDPNEPISVWSANITHNLGNIAAEVGLYRYLWRPEEFGIVCAEQLIRPLHLGAAYMHSNYDKLVRLESANGWGKLSYLTAFVNEYRRACVEHPHAIVEVSR